MRDSLVEAALLGSYSESLRHAGVRDGIHALLGRAQRIHVVSTHGIENDSIELPWGVRARVAVAEVRLGLMR